MGSVGKTVANAATLGAYDYFTGSGSGSSTTNVNAEATKTAETALTNAENFGRTGLEGALSGLTAYKSDPTAYYNNFMSQASGLADLVSGSQSALQTSLTERAGQLATEATNSAASNLSGLGSLYSGATLGAAADASSKAFADVANQLGTQQINLTGNLWNTALGTAASSQSASDSANLQALLGAASGYGDVYGSALSGLTGLGSSEYLTTQTTSPWANLFQTGVGAAAQAGSKYLTGKA